MFGSRTSHSETVKVEAVAAYATASGNPKPSDRRGTQPCRTIFCSAVKHPPDTLACGAVARLSNILGRRANKTPLNSQVVFSPNGVMSITFVFKRDRASKSKALEDPYVGASRGLGGFLCRCDPLTSPKGPPDFARRCNMIIPKSLPT